MKRRGKEREGKEREGKERKGKGREGKERKGKGREGKGREGKERKGKEREGKEGPKETDSRKRKPHLSVAQAAIISYDSTTREGVIKLVPPLVVFLLLKRGGGHNGKLGNRPYLLPPPEGGEDCRSALARILRTICLLTIRKT